MIYKQSKVLATGRILENRKKRHLFGSEIEDAGQQDKSEDIVKFNCDHGLERGQC